MRIVERLRSEVCRLRVEAGAVETIRCGTRDEFRRAYDAAMARNGPLRVRIEGWESRKLVLMVTVEKPKPSGASARSV